MTVRFEDKLAEYVNRRKPDSASTTAFVRATGYLHFAGTTVSTSKAPDRNVDRPNEITRQAIDEARNGVNMVRCKDKKDLFDRLND